jgi:hypothetical protein
LDVLTKKYESGKNTLQLMPEDMREIHKKELRRSFDENLLKLMKKTRDPKLFARIIREGGKIDAVISNIVSKGLHRYGICEGFVGGDKLE